MAEQFTIIVSFERFRCYECGRWRLCEMGISHACPYCAQSRIDRVLSRQEELERSNAALRGVISRLKGAT